MANASSFYLRLELEDARGVKVASDDVVVPHARILNTFLTPRSAPTLEAEYVINERAYESTMLELETRSERVALIEDLVNEGAESKMRLLDEKLALVDTQRRLSEISSRREALKFQKELPLYC